MQCKVKIHYRLGLKFRMSLGIKIRNTGLKFRRIKLVLRKEFS